MERLCTVRAGLPGLCQRHRKCVRPRIPGLSPGWSGASPHVLRFPLRAFLRFPVCPPGSPPSSAFPGFPSSGVLRFVPFGRCPVRVPRQFPFGFPFPGAVFTLPLLRGGSPGTGPGRRGLRSPVLPRLPRPGSRSARTRWRISSLTLKVPSQPEKMCTEATSPVARSPFSLTLLRLNYPRVKGTVPGWRPRTQISPARAKRVRIVYLATAMAPAWCR